MGIVARVKIVPRAPLFLVAFEGLLSAPKPDGCLRKKAGGKKSGAIIWAPHGKRLATATLYFYYNHEATPDKTKLGI